LGQLRPKFFHFESPRFVGARLTLFSRVAPPLLAAVVVRADMARASRAVLAGKAVAACAMLSAAAAGSPEFSWATAFLVTGPGVQGVRGQPHGTVQPWARPATLIETGARGRDASAQWALTLGSASLVVAAAAGLLRRRSVACAAYEQHPPRARKKHRNPQEHQLGYRITGGPGYPGSPHAWTEPIRWCQRFKRRITIRRKMEGTIARPRLAVFRSKEHLHVNVVDDTQGNGITLLTSTTRQKHNMEAIRETQGVERGKEKTWSEEAAEIIGRDVAKRCLEKDITMVCFDRGGFPYGGRVKALAEAARSAGLQF